MTQDQALDVRALTDLEIEEIAGGPLFLAPGYLAMQGFKAGVYTYLWIQTL
jgi:hypothetical protein